MIDDQHIIRSIIEGCIITAWGLFKVLWPLIILAFWMIYRDELAELAKGPK
jgi:hypothetical protein